MVAPAVQERRRSPTAVLDAPRAVLWIPVLVSLAVLGLAGLATYGDEDRRWVMLAVAGEADGLPGWWATVLYVLVALACLLRARGDWMRGRRAGTARAGTASAAWVGVAGLLSVLSVDHVLGLHNLLDGDPRLAALPEPVAAHPVQAALVVAGLPLVLVLLALTTPRQRLLLVVAGGLYLVSGLLLDQRIVQPSWNHVRVETLEVAFEWAGALLLLHAAMARVRMAPRRGAAPPRAVLAPDPLPDPVPGPVPDPVPGPVPAPPAPGAALLEVVAVMDRLRSPGGCPWDAAQTHASLAPYAVEEGHEVAEAAESGDLAALREELGDLLLQVVFHARVAAEHPTEPFDVDDVARTLVAKLRRRHPHVFGTGTGTGAGAGRGLDAAGVEASWEELKAAERGARSALDGVPASLPALARAQEVLGRAERIGGVPGPRRAEVPAGVELGEHLLALAQAARERGEDAEAQLRAAVRRLEQRARSHEAAPVLD